MMIMSARFNLFFFNEIDVLTDEKITILSALKCRCDVVLRLKYRIKITTRSRQTTSARRHHMQRPKISGDGVQVAAEETEGKSWPRCCAPVQR